MFKGLLHVTWSLIGAPSMAAITLAQRHEGDFKPRAGNILLVTSFIPYKTLRVLHYHFYFTNRIQK